MDHANAHFIEFSMDSEESITVNSKFTHEEKEKTLGKNESLMHHKEQHQQLEYFNSLKDKMKDYDEIVLFGPTDAKSQLHNLLTKDAHFSKKIIEVKNAGKLTENQQQAFVRDHFSKKIIRF